MVLPTTTSITFTETITSEFPQCPIATVIDQLIDSAQNRALVAIEKRQEQMVASLQNTLEELRHTLQSNIN